MRQGIRTHLTYANVAATLALIIAVSGGAAYAANTIDSSDIVDNQVYSADVRDDSLAGGGLSATDLQAGSVGTSEVQNNQIRSADVRDDSLAGGGLAATDLGPDSAGLGEIDPNAFNAGDISATAGNPFEIPGNAIQSFEVSDNGLTGADISENTLSVAGLGCQAGLILGFARIKGGPSMPSTYTSSSTYIDTKRNCSGGTVEVRRVGTGLYSIRFPGLSAVLALGTSNLGAPTVCEDNLVSVGKFLDDTPSSFSVASFDDDGDPQDCWVTVAVI
jgi:hypothetical protein